MLNPDANGPMSRRSFVRQTTALAAATWAADALVEEARASGANGSPSPAGTSGAGTSGAGTSAPTASAPHPFLTPAEKFNTVARGNPKPHTLMGEAAAAARLTPDTWRLEITADPFTEPPAITQAATLEKPRTLVDGTALDLKTLQELGQRHGVKFVKALQCLNIPTPLGQGLWEGVPLREVLRLCGRMNNVRRVYFWGFHNNDPKQIFQSSLSYSQAMETPPGELPVFLAYQLNGQPISPLRGGPVRMIVPWAYGFKNIKWLQHIFVTNDYRANDTYALSNNDPDSPLKTAAYIDDGPAKIAAGEPLFVTGQVISGLSGLQRVEYLLRLVPPDAQPLAEDDPELQRGPWQPCELLPPPDWSTVLPAGVSSRDLLGFDPRTGQPRTWPPRYGLGAWTATLRDLKPGPYELRVRAIDLNGLAQPEPRPLLKSGRNAIPVRRFEVT